MLKPYKYKASTSLSIQPPYFHFPSSILCQMEQTNTGIGAKTTLIRLEVNLNLKNIFHFVCFSSVFHLFHAVYFSVGFQHVRHDRHSDWLVMKVLDFALLAKKNRKNMLTNFTTILCERKCLTEQEPKSHRCTKFSLILNESNLWNGIALGKYSIVEANRKKKFRFVSQKDILIFISRSPFSKNSWSIFHQENKVFPVLFVVTFWWMWECNQF